MFDVTSPQTSLYPNLAFNVILDSCALSAQSVENVLTSWDTNGSTDMTAGIGGGTSAGLSSLSAAGTAAYNNLISKGWTITINA